MVEATQWPLLGRHYRDDGKDHVPMTEAQSLARDRFRKRVRTGEYRFTDVQCLCGATHEDAVLLSAKDRYGFSLNIWLCKKCALIYTSPYFDDTSLSRFYSEDYRDVYEDDPRALEGFFLSRYRLGQEILMFIRSEISSVKQMDVFEIGCAAGGVLQAFADQGASCSGCDLDDRYLDYGRLKGLQLFRQSFTSLELNDQKYDLVIISEVLEHLREPRATLRKIRGMLKPGGRVYVEVPNVAPRIDLLGHLQNAHVWYFDRLTLERLLNECGFRVLLAQEPSIILQILAEPADSRKTIMSEDHRLKLRAFQRAERFRSLRRDAVRWLKRLRKTC